MSNRLDETHFLNLPRPDVFVGAPAGAPDTTTLAAHDFDVDTRTGFMPPQQPPLRLPADWEPWEQALDSAVSSRLQLGKKPGLTEEDKEKSETWRRTVRELPILPVTELKKSEVLLRRAHHILAWIMHFYVHSLPPSSPIKIPPPITLPLLQVSAQLQLPPVLTYSDDVLYNWKFITDKLTDDNGNDILPTVTNIDSQTSFTSTRDEAEFYLSSARLELRGVDALEIMRSIMDEAFVGDDIALRRITQYLQDLAVVIRDFGKMLMNVTEGCSPRVFFEEVRPWFNGEDSASGARWEWEGIELDETLTPPTELSGASAGQSALIHALDVFLGVDKFSHSSKLTIDASPSSSEASSSSATKPGSTHQPSSSFLTRMQKYMPRHHRAFLNHLARNPRPVRELVISSQNPKLVESYNAAVQALKEFRDKHMIIVALYIIRPARAKREGVEQIASSAERAPLKGTGGTDLVKFLKGVRDQTKSALVDAETL